MPESRAICTDACIPANVSSIASRMLFRVLLLRERYSCAFEFFFQQLFLIKVRIISATRQQIFMRAAFDDLSIAQNDNLVGLLHRGSAMRNQNCRSPGHDPAQAR